MEKSKNYLPQIFYQEFDKTTSVNSLECEVTQAAGIRYAVMLYFVVRLIVR
jgi:hypothetical protein